MRQATEDDLGVMDVITAQCGLPPLPRDLFNGCLAFIGEHGHIILDPLNNAQGIIHVTVAPKGRGKWGKDFFRAAIRWLFTSTRVENILAAIPEEDQHVVFFAMDSWFRVVYNSGTHSYVNLDLLRWVAKDPLCLVFGEEGFSDYELADQHMVKRVFGACKMVREAGMPHKAWHIHNLYAKLFGYKAEV